MNLLVFLPSPPFRPCVGTGVFHNSLGNRDHQPTWPTLRKFRCGALSLERPLERQEKRLHEVAKDLEALTQLVILTCETQADVRVAGTEYAAWNRHDFLINRKL